jgi:hypothetical protein
MHLSPGDNDSVQGDHASAHGGYISAFRDHVSLYPHLVDENFLIGFEKKLYERIEKAGELVRMQLCVSDISGSSLWPYISYHGQRF